MSRLIRCITTIVAVVVLMSIGACQEIKEETEYKSIYESDLDFEKLYDEINNEEETSWVQDIQIIKDTGEFGAILYDENAFQVEEPPMPKIGIRRQGNNGFLDSNDRIQLYNPFELVVKADPDFVQSYPNQVQYRIDKLSVVINRPGLVPLEKEYTYGELMERLSLINQEKGEYVYTIDPFDISYDPSGYMVRIYVKGASRIKPNGERIALDLSKVPSEFAYRFSR